jgi:1,4-alpha-glucan branching enzyme
MKALFVLAFLVLSILYLDAQVVTTSPAFPFSDNADTIFFHADQGNKGLMNYSGTDVYAHTGVITDQSTSSSDWKYVKAAWTTNLPACKLTKKSANLYQLVITPSIREFYGVPPAEKILKMTFVFRNSTGAITGRDVSNADIFVNVYEAGLHVSFASPADRFTLLSAQGDFPVQINASGADSLLLYLDNSLIHKSSALILDTTLQATDFHSHRLIAMARKSGEVAADTTWYLVQKTTTQSPLPAGLQDGISYPADDSACFVLFAPHKSSVYLLGDFNDWLPDSTWQLKEDGDRFWLGIGGLVPGKEYAFQYMVDGQIRIADPYSEKILDPDNDKYIPASVYPGLLSYPTGKTHDIAGIIQPGKAPFVWNQDGYVPPQQKDLVIYELLIRDFVTSHDIIDAVSKLDYLQTLGVNAIELMPFSEFEGNSSWGYNPSFYFAPDKYYGRDTDFKEFIQECHQRGIAVIMDMVLNHAYNSNPMVRLYFNTLTGKPTPDNPWFNVTSPNPVYSWGNDFNHESPATQYFVDRVVAYWLEEYKLDGFRFDFTKGFTNTPGDGSAYDASRIAILERIYNKIKSVNPLADMICEHFSVNTEEKELSDYGMMLWGNENYNYNEATMGYLDNSDFSWASSKSRGWTNPNLVSYMESHDEERLMFKNITYGNSSGTYNIKVLDTALQRQELAGAFFFTIPGPKMIWQFGELGYDISINYNGRVGEKPILWDYEYVPAREKLYLTWAKIIDIRKKYPVFSTDDYTMTVGNNVAVKKIVLRQTDADAIVIGNFGIDPASAHPGFTKTGWWYELFSRDSVNVSDVNLTVTLNPGEYRIYASRKMESVISGTQDNLGNTIVMYPNPVADRLYIDADQRIEGLDVYDITGSKVISGFNAQQPDVLDVSRLKPGLYMIVVQTGNVLLKGKFLKK